MLPFKSSPLGTKEYWDDIYKREKECYLTNGDEGEVWFGEGVEGRIVRFILGKQGQYSRIIDLGCGNGHLLRKLEEGFSVCSNEGGGSDDGSGPATLPTLLGIDYSESGIEMAKQSSVNNSIKYMVKDIFSSDIADLMADLIIDKGTFDAISLSSSSSSTTTTEEEDSDRLCRIAKEYIASVKMIAPLLLLTSCNYTKDELCLLFPAVLEEIKHPSFRFGNQSGQTVTTLLIDLS